MTTGRRILRMRLVLAALVAAAATQATTGWAADEELARLIEGAKKEGEVHYIDALNQPKTQDLLDRAFRKKYGLPESFKFTHTLRGTGEVVASVQQEIKAGQHTIDIIWVGAPGFFRAACSRTSRSVSRIAMSSRGWSPGRKPLSSRLPMIS